MPTILRVGPYRYFFYSNEGMESPHIHVEAAGNSAKFWLQPVALAATHGFPTTTIREIERIFLEHRDELESMALVFPALVPQQGA